jgi:hypothetical protein
MKMEIGLNGYLLNHDPMIWDNIMSSTWLKWTRKFAAEYLIQMRDDLPDFSMKREGDELLNGHVHALGIPGTRSLQVEYMSIALEGDYSIGYYRRKWRTSN